MQEFMEYQKRAYQTMDQVRALLADITVAKNSKENYLMGGGTGSQNASRDTLKQMKGMLEEQNERQQAALEEMNKNLRDLSKNAQKGKFSLFK